LDLVIVTGMSGAGKTQAINALEDIGYFCVDNVPPRLLGKFSELMAESDGKVPRVALVVDVRSKELFADYIACLRELRAGNVNLITLFLDCDDAALRNRYKETRRRHPLIGDEISSIEDAIRLERSMLGAAKARADYTIDTSLIGATQLRSRVRDLFLGGVRQSMMVQCLSFGFKYGVPVDSDLLFDVRCLPNPFYVEELREKTGLDDAVRDYVLGSLPAQGLLTRLYELVDYLIPLYIQEGKSQLTISIGCTGGKHRSVVFAELMAAHLGAGNTGVHVTHRDISLSSRS
jgi:UPF0042 nucleotide-binding protein